MVGLLNEALLVVSLRWTLLPRSLFVKVFLETDRIIEKNIHRIGK